MLNGARKRQVTNGDAKKVKTAFIGCSVFITFVLFVLVLLMISLFRSPYYQHIAECRSNIQRLGDALGRYADKNDAYPDELTDLVPDYIPKSVLYCPSDKKNKSRSTYEYNKPEIDYPGNAIILICYNHHGSSSVPGVRIHYLKNGTVTLWSAQK